MQCSMTRSDGVKLPLLLSDPTRGRAKCSDNEDSALQNHRERIEDLLRSEQKPESTADLFSPTWVQCMWAQTGALHRVYSELWTCVNLLGKAGTAFWWQEPCLRD